MFGGYQTQVLISNIKIYNPGNGFDSLNIRNIYTTMADMLIWDLH